MGSTSIKPHFMSFIEKSNQVKMQIDSTLALLSANETSSNIDVSNMLELNELFTLVDTFLKEFQKSLRIELNVDKKKDRELKENIEKKNDENSKVHETVVETVKLENNSYPPNNYHNNRLNNQNNVGNVELKSDISHRKNVIENYKPGDSAVSKDVYSNTCLNEENIEPFDRNQYHESNHNDQTNVPEQCNEKVIAINGDAREKNVPDNCDDKDTVIKDQAPTNEENSAPEFVEGKVLAQNRTHTKKTNDETHTNQPSHPKGDWEFMYNFDSNSYYSTSSSDYTSAGSSESYVSGHITHIERKKLLQLHKAYKVSIKHVEDLNSFFVYVMTDATKEFFKKWETMVKFYKRHSKDEAYSLSEDSLEKDSDIFVAVRYKSRWCRGKVLGYHDGILNLYLIDFGSRIESPIDACRHLKCRFNFPSVLQNVGLNLQFSPTRQAVFDALVYNRVIYEVWCVRQVENRFQVVIQEMSDISINYMIESIPVPGLNGTTGGETDEALAVDTDQALEEFDPMKEDFLAETNDYNINPDNACQAVMGYIPSDDQRFCKFGKSCRKKKCFRLHQQEQDPNGWTKDTEPILTRPYETTDLPQNELVQIQVTSVVNIGEFYAHLDRSCDSTADDEEETFESLIEYMNKVENVQAMKKLRTQPARGEILIACYKGYFHRGKVLSYNDETDSCQVFFGDFGVSEHIHLKDLRQMESKYNYLPFQALHFSVRQHLDFAIPRESEQYELCLHVFRGLIQFQSFHCVIQSSNTEPADVLLFTKDQIDVVEYFSKCCKRIVGEDEESGSACASSVGGSSGIGGLNRSDMTFVPA